MEKKEDKHIDSVAVEKFKATIQIKAPEKKCDVKVHLLPCHALQSGPAPVSAYFQPVKITDAKWEKDNMDKMADVDTVQFRGRQLVSKPLTLPDNMHGYLFEDSDKNGAERIWKTCGTFDKFHIWARDRNLQERDHLHRTITEWPQIASIIHDPIV